jgi:hypothetical protein
MAGKLSADSFESEYNVYKLLIGGNEITDFCIVVPEGATTQDNAHYSAERMKYYIEIATGVELDICYGSENRTKPHAIVYNMVALDSELGEELGYEGYKYDITDGNLNIYGTSRGYMYATYDILEDHLGYRFLMSEYVYQYGQRSVDLAEGTYVFYEPALDFRLGGVGGGKESEMHELRYMARKNNGKQVSAYYDDKYGTQTGPHFINAHSYGYYWKMATGEVDVSFDGSNFAAYEAKYNAGFQQDEYKWNPCFTSDEVYGTLFRGLLETMRYMQSWWQRSSPIYR